MGTQPLAGRCGAQQDARRDRPQGLCMCRTCRLHQRTECTTLVHRTHSCGSCSTCHLSAAGRRSEKLSLLHSTPCNCKLPAHTARAQCHHTAGGTRLHGLSHTPKTFFAAFRVMRRWLQSCAAEQAGGTLHHQLGLRPTASTFVSP